MDDEQDSTEAQYGGPATESPPPGRSLARQRWEKAQRAPLLAPDGSTAIGRDLIDDDQTAGDLNDGDRTDSDLTDGDLNDGDRKDSDLTDGDLNDGDLKDSDLKDSDLSAGDLADGESRL